MDTGWRQCPRKRRR